MRWHRDYIDGVKKSIAAANEELEKAMYLGECGANAGLRAIWSKRASWLSDVLYAAREQLKEQEAALREEQENGKL